MLHLLVFLGLKKTVILDSIRSKIHITNINTKNFKYLEILASAIPQFYRTGEIGMSLGADLFSYILENGRVIGGSCKPSTFNTISGIGKTENALSNEVKHFFSATQQ